jgi:hypothetical protein
VQRLQRRHDALVHPACLPARARGNRVTMVDTPNLGPAFVPSPYDDAWNAEHRDEAPMQRADRNFAELLQELRVAQTGVQILFGFMLWLSFTDRFIDLDTYQRGMYLTALVASAVTAVLLVAPAAAHRLCFQQGRKRELVRIGHRLALAGLVGLATTVTAGMLLVLDVVVDRKAALLGGGGLVAVFAVLWIVLPLRVRRR